MSTIFNQHVSKEDKEREMALFLAFDQARVDAILTDKQALLPSVIRAPRSLPRRVSGTRRRSKRRASA